MKYIIAIAIATVGYILAVDHLEQTFGSYYDYVAFVVVIAGIIAVALITIPKMKYSVVLQVLLLSIFRNRASKSKFLKDCLNLVSGNNPINLDDPSYSKRAEYRVLRDGFELITLSFSKEKIESILEDRIIFQRERVGKIATWLRSLSKYPPAFGLSATVLGLIHLMRGISDGMDAKETGIRMAIALVATFYGLVIANLLINPLGEAVNEQGVEQDELSEIALKTVLMAKDKVNLLEVQEQLNSYAEDDERIDVVGSSSIQETVQ